MNPAESDPPALDTPGALNRQIIATSEQLRRLAGEAASGGRTARALSATAELSRLLELRLRIAGVLQTGPGRPKKGPGRPAADGGQEHEEGGHPGLYEVAAALRAALLELPADRRAGAAAVLADAFPALLAEPLEAVPRRPATPAHLRPGADAPPPWVRQQWGG